jgi:hypothetical protein
MKIIRFALFLAFLPLLQSCGSFLNSKPSGTLSEERMAEVLVDIHLTEAMLKLNNDSVSRVSDTAGLRIRFAEVFRKNDVSPDDFNQSLTWYMQHIEELDKIYTNVINRLTELDARTAKESSSIPGFRNGPSAISRGPLPNNPWYRSLVPPDTSERPVYFDKTVYPD